MQVCLTAMAQISDPAGLLASTLLLLLLLLLLLRAAAVTKPVCNEVLEPCTWPASCRITACLLPGAPFRVLVAFVLLLLSSATIQLSRSSSCRHAGVCLASKQRAYVRPYIALVAMYNLAAEVQAAVCSCKARAAAPARLVSYPAGRTEPPVI